MTVGGGNSTNRDNDGHDAKRQSPSPSPSLLGRNGGRDDDNGGQKGGRGDGEATAGQVRGDGDAKAI